MSSTEFIQRYHCHQTRAFKEIFVGICNNVHLSSDLARTFLQLLLPKVFDINLRVSYLNLDERHLFFSTCLVCLGASLGARDPHSPGFQAGETLCRIAVLILHSSASLQRAWPSPDVGRRLGLDLLQPRLFC